VRRDDYAKVVNFIDSSRNAFRAHLGWVSLFFRGRLDCLLTSKFELSSSFSTGIVADRVYLSLAPIISFPLSP
jgi:hypothetical protein